MEGTEQGASDWLHIFSISFPRLRYAQCSQNFQGPDVPRLVCKPRLLGGHRQEELAAAAAEMDDMVGA